MSYPIGRVRLEPLIGTLGMHVVVTNDAGTPLACGGVSRDDVRGEYDELVVVVFEPRDCDLGIVAVGFGLGLLSKVAAAQRQELSLSTAELAELESRKELAFRNLTDLRGAKANVFKQLAEMRALIEAERAKLPDTYPTVYPAPEDLAPLAAAAGDPA